MYRILIAAFFLGAGASPLCAWRAVSAAELERFEFTQPHMGVEFKLLFYAAERGTANQAAEAAFARIGELDSRLSDYQADSELSLLSATAGSGRRVPVSDDLWTVLAAAQEVAERSEGAFDATVGPLVKLWRRARRAKELPPAEQLAAAREAVGYRHVVLDAQRRTVELRRPAMRLDLGGIAKGYAADEALKALAEHGITRALVAASGDLAIGEPPPGTEGWRIGIAALSPDDPPQRNVLLARCGISTSGDARQHVAIGGQRYSHIIDPRTGLGLTTRSTVSVIAPTATASDALASAVCVLGPERGLKLIEATQGAAAIMVTELEGKITTHESSGMKEIDDGT